MTILYAIEVRIAFELGWAWDCLVGAATVWQRNRVNEWQLYQGRFQ